MSKRWAYSWEVWRDRRQKPSALVAQQQRRLAELVRYARAHSPFYEQRYHYLPAEGYDLHQLPPVTKSELMASFDQWVTDPQVTPAGVADFLADRQLIGQRYLGRYAVWRTSGVTGRPGVFLHDKDALAIYAALAHRNYSWMTPRRFWQLLRGGWRWATLVATEGHFTVIDYQEGLRRSSPLLRESVRAFSVHRPLPELVQAINAFQPVILVGYPSIIKLLALEQQAGRLRIQPVFISTGGEWLAPSTRRLLETQFRCLVRNSYAASEFLFMAFDCGQGWLHTNADWLLLEPVDAQYRAVEAGQPSATVLLTNLANRVQPISRYDLGDSVTLRPDPCPCGNPLPALQVEGRRDETLCLRKPDGKEIALTPLALTTVVEETPGVQRFQLIQTAPATLHLRLEVLPGTEGTQVCEEVIRCLRVFLSTQELSSVTLEHDPEPPELHPVSGKFRHVWAEQTRVGKQS